MTASDSRVTDEMVNAALKAHYKHSYKTLFTGVHGIPDHSGAMRLAIEAAISHQAPAVAVSELEALDRWDVFAECGYNGSGYVERQVYADGEFIRHDDLRTLINKAGSDET